MRRATLAALGALVVVVGLIGLALWALSQRTVSPSQVAETCTASVDLDDGQGRRTWSLDPDQAETAGLLSGQALARGLPARAVTIAIATAAQESRLRNIDYGDRDSLGIFQQRPSQGWGTPAQILDPVYATNAFYDALVEVPDYQSLSVTVAAQAVQRSAFPEAYADHEDTARAFASALTGHSPAALTCTLAAPTGPGSVPDLGERVERDLGEGVEATADGEAGLVLSRPSVTGSEARRLAWADAQWAVTQAKSLAVSSVQVADQVWDRSTGRWTPASSTLPTGRVRVTLAAPEASAG